MIRGGRPDREAGLLRRGLGAGELDDAGIEVGPDGELHVPVRDEHGRQLAVRRYAGVSAGARPLGDLDAPALDDPRLPDARWGQLEWRGVFAVAHHVARPPPGLLPALQDVGAVLVDDEYGAEFAARRLGVPAVAPSDLGLIAGAAELAARLAGARRTVLALARSPESDADQVRGIRFSQCAAAVESVGGRPCLTALPRRGRLEDVLRAGHLPRLKPIDFRRVQLDGWERGHVIALGRVAWHWRRALSRLRWRRSEALARRGGPPLLEPRDMPSVWREHLEAAAEIQALGRDCGAELLVHGGVAVDLIAGRPVRARKDVDLIMVEGEAPASARLIRAAQARGFEIWLDLPGSYLALRRGEALIDIWQSRPVPGGRLVSSRNVFLRMTPPYSDGVARSLGGVTLDTLHPHYVLALKQRQLDEVHTCFPRWSLYGMPLLMDDVAALRATLQTHGDDFSLSRLPADRGECLSLSCDPGPVTLRQLREFVAVHLLGRQVR